MERGVVLITGGTGGIGKAIALELAKNDYDIVINFHSAQDKAKGLKEQLEKEFSVRCLT